MSAGITLVWIGGGEPPPWPKGPTLRSEASPSALAETIERELPRSQTEAWLFWDRRLGAPDPARAEKALSRPGDLWHAGLRLGMAGLPRGIDHVAPTWMLNRDPDPSIEATSWRVSMGACLVRSDVLRRLGGLRPEFRTLAASGLEFGHRAIGSGALARHLPWLIGDAARAFEIPKIPIEDELRFLHHRFGGRWTRWSVFRTACGAPWRTPGLLAVLRRVLREGRPPAPPPLREGPGALGGPRAAGSVTVLIPTVDRYPYLETLLEQLRSQTVPPLEIVIVDQTRKDRRRTDLAARFPDLPIRVFALDRAGQCSSRNTGIEASRGDFLLFLDDDDEVPPDLIERHLEALEAVGSEVSSGVAEETGAPLPEAFKRTRTSDVFPTNNSLIRKSILAGSGLFDLAYDRGARADADLGMRIYLAGNLMVLNSDIRVLHHHAPSGGLRTHGARVITYASSRNRLLHRHLPTTTELYLDRRYFSKRQVSEAIWLSLLGTFSVRGSAPRRAAKAALAVLLLPHTLWVMRKHGRRAAELLRDHPRIPRYTAADPISKVV